MKEITAISRLFWKLFSVQFIAMMKCNTKNFMWMKLVQLGEERMEKDWYAAQKWTFFCEFTLSIKMIASEFKIGNWKTV